MNLVVAVWRLLDKRRAEVFDCQISGLMRKYFLGRTVPLIVNQNGGDMARDEDLHNQEQPQQEPNGQKESPADPAAVDNPTPSGPNGDKTEDK